MFSLLKKKKNYETKNGQNSFILNLKEAKRFGYVPHKCKKTIIDFVTNKI
jgi:hypothetical protein